MSCGSRGVLSGFGGSNLKAKLLKVCCATQHTQESSLCHQRMCPGTTEEMMMSNARSSQKNSRREVAEGEISQIG